uniref:Uncharacterized protein n=1 Tax=Steinernema glaseri TaxID=37863 RepID=A0A1I7YSX8_9BILA
MAAQRHPDIRTLQANAEKSSKENQCRVLFWCALSSEFASHRMFSVLIRISLAAKKKSVVTLDKTVVPVLQERFCKSRTDGT